MILKDAKKAKELSEKSLIKSGSFDSKIIESREREIYQEILSKKQVQNNIIKIQIVKN